MSNVGGIDLSAQSVKEGVATDREHVCKQCRRQSSATTGQPSCTYPFPVDGLVLAIYLVARDVLQQRCGIYCTVCVRL